MKLGEYMARKGKKIEYDVALIHPVTFFNMEYNYFNMGLLYMGTILQKGGYRVKCLDGIELFHTPLDDIKKIFTEHGAKIAGFYTISDNINAVAKMAQDIKEWAPETTVVVGGPLATSLGEKMLENPHFDISATGEGEITFPQLVEWKIKNKGRLSDIAGIIYSEDGKVIVNPPGPVITDLDSLPFPNHALVRVSDSFHLVSGRGCPYNCIFCYQGVHGLRYRYRSVSNLAEEVIANMETYHCNYFDIIDDTFIANPKRVMEFAAEMKRYKESSDRDFVFFCQGRIDVIDRHPEMLSALKDAGAIRIQVGIESGHPETLKIYEKKITVEQIKRVAAELAKVSGMCMTGNFILGGPFEREETFEASVKLAKELTDIAPGAIDVNAGFMTPYPGARIAKNPDKYGLKTVDDDFVKGLASTDVHMISEHLDVQGVRSLKERFYTRTISYMRKKVKDVPHDLLRKHYEWMWKYGVNSQWRQLILSKRQALGDYFRYLQSPRFAPFKEVPLNDILRWTPQRVQAAIMREDEGRTIILPETTAESKLKDKNERLVYELCAGKLNVEDMIRRFISESGTDMDKDEVLGKVFIPMFKKLADEYQVVFYR